MPYFAKIITKLQARFTKKPEAILQNCKYVDLAATDEADENGTYSEALFLRGQ